MPGLRPPLLEGLPLRQPDWRRLPESSSPGDAPDRSLSAWHNVGRAGRPLSGGNPMRVWPGHPYPLGATWDGAGVNFALFSEHATKVELCLFDSAAAGQEAHRIPLNEYTDK